MLKIRHIAKPQTVSCNLQKNRVKYKSIVIITILWIFIVILDYYQIPYFISPFLWLILSIFLLIDSIIQIVKIFRRKENFRIIKSSISLCLLFLTVYGFYGIPHKLIENIDWKIYKNERMKIVNDVLNGKLKPNSTYNQQLCSLNNNYKNVSNGGNEILISSYKGKKTIKFWISRGFFDAPQSYFIYTNSNEDQKFYENLIKKDQNYNWKIEPNWYRIVERE